MISSLLLLLSEKETVSECQTGITEKKSKEGEESGGGQEDEKGETFVRGGG